MEQVQESGLNSLLLIYARLLLSRDTVLGFLREGSEKELERKLADAEGRLPKAASDAMKHSLEANAEILRKRLEHRRNARENLQVIDSELERIENQVDLMREDVAVSRDPGVLSARIDAIATTIGEASSFLKANEALLGALGPEEEAAVAPPARRPRAGERE
jgi:hypothetical protein